LMLRAAGPISNRPRSCAAITAPRREIVLNVMQAGVGQRPDRDGAQLDGVARGPKRGRALPGLRAHATLILALLGRPVEADRWAATAERDPAAGTLPDGNTMAATLAKWLPYLGLWVISVVMGGSVCIKAMSFGAMRVRAALDSGARLWHLLVIKNLALLCVVAPFVAPIGFLLSPVLACERVISAHS
jgi:hypothetical protein